MTNKHMWEQAGWQTETAHWIAAGNHQLEASCYGPPPDQAPTIVMLHEGLGSLSLWRDFPEKLAEATGWGVLVYSRAGYGQSSPVELPRPLDYMTREAIDVLPRILDAISFKRGILLGHSDGATIAAIYTGSLIDHRIRGLALIAPHFFTEEIGLSAIAASKRAYDSGDLREKLAKYHTNVDVAFQGWNQAWFDPDFRDWNVADVIDYWRVPVLAIQGREDQYGTLAQIDEIEQRIYAPLEKAILDNCQHAPHIEQPELTLSAIKNFIIRLERIETEEVKLV